MFSACIWELLSFTNHLIISCDERLISLFKRSFDPSISFVSKNTSISEDRYDSHIPIGSIWLFMAEL